MQHKNRFLAAALTLLAAAITCLPVGSSRAADRPPYPTERSHRASIVRIPMRDGTELVGDLVLPGKEQPGPLVVAITPYGRHALYNVGKTYAQAGLGFLGVDVRGRGDSAGNFHMFYSDLNDTVDVIAWVIRQNFSNGKVAMWGASYGGYNQWMAAAKKAPGLVTIMPSASVLPGHDFPMFLNIGYPYSSQWTAFTAGRMANFNLFGDQQFWREAFTEALGSGKPFSSFDKVIGFKSDLFGEWVAHPSQDAYWDAINPTAAEMAEIDMPILSVTGLYDGAQLGALAYYRMHMANASSAARAKHFLVIGPYDHAGVGFPTPSVAGLPVPDRGGMEPVRLSAEWYAWTMSNGPKPAFLRDRVMYYVMGANEWRSAPSLEDIPVRKTVFNLVSPASHDSLQGSATSVSRAGTLIAQNAEAVSNHDATREDIRLAHRETSSSVTYRYDPRNIDKAPLGGWFEGPFALYDADVKAIDGDGFVFETRAFAKPVELIGAPRFEAMISINTPDTDFRLRIYEVRPDGTSVYLSETRQRARYRRSNRIPELVTSSKPERYVFEEFTFAARRLDPGSKLRFVFDPPNSVYVQRNYNSGKTVADETPADARTVDVKMLLGGKNGARLSLPLRQAETY